LLNRSKSGAGKIARAVLPRDKRLCSARFALDEVLQSLFRLPVFCSVVNPSVYPIAEFVGGGKVGPVGRRNRTSFLRLRNRNGNGPFGAHHTRPMRTILLAFPSKLPRSSLIESRVIFWNLLFTMALSSLLLLLYLKKIIFDF
jgi:hypothetical protein